MTQLQEFLFNSSFGKIKEIRDYMMKNYNVYCGSIKELEKVINEYIPNGNILEEMYNK